MTGISAEEEKSLLNPTGGPIFEFKKPKPITKIIPLTIEINNFPPIQGPHNKHVFTKLMLENQEKRIKNRQIPVDLPLPVFANSIIRKLETPMDVTPPSNEEEKQSPTLGNFN